MEGVSNAAGYISGDTCLCFSCGGTQMGGERYVFHPQERIVFRFERFICPHIDAGTGNFSGF